jgi:hypothetical protein
LICFPVTIEGKEKIKEYNASPAGKKIKENIKVEETWGNSS